MSNESEPSDYEFTHHFRVRYAEVDQQKVVFNGHYLNYVDIGLTELFRVLDWDYQQALQEQGDFHVVHAELDYLAPLRFDERITIALRCERLGRSSVRYGWGIFGPEDDLRARGEIVHVWVELASGQAGAVPQGFREAIEVLSDNAQASS